MERERAPVDGLVGEFDSVEDLLEAVHLAYATGYRRMDAYTPFFVEELAEALGQPRTNWLAWLLMGGLGAGALGGLGMMIYGRAIAYPVNIGGRPLISWPAFVPIAFVLSILFASLAVVAGFLLLTRLPKRRQAIFNLPQFNRSRQDRYFLYIQVDDPSFDETKTRQFFERVAAREVVEVER